MTKSYKENDYEVLVLDEPCSCAPTGTHSPVYYKSIKDCVIAQSGFSKGLHQGATRYWAIHFNNEHVLTAKYRGIKV